MRILRMGIYRHYKGALYQVISLAHDANHDDRTCVVYLPLQLDAAHLGPRMAVRTIDDFKAMVHVSQAGDNWPTCPGAHECSIVQRSQSQANLLTRYDETHRFRFAYLGPVLTHEMLPGATL